MSKTNKIVFEKNTKPHGATGRLTVKRPNGVKRSVPVLAFNTLEQKQIENSIAQVVTDMRAHGHGIDFEAMGLEKD